MEYYETQNISKIEKRRKKTEHLWPSGLRRRTRDPTVVSSKPRSDISVEVTAQC